MQTSCSGLLRPHNPGHVGRFVIPTQPHKRETFFRNHISSNHLRSKSVDIPNSSIDRQSRSRQPSFRYAKDRFQHIRMSLRRFHGPHFTSPWSRFRPTHAKPYSQRSRLNPTQPLLSQLIDSERPQKRQTGRPCTHPSPHVTPFFDYCESTVEIAAEVLLRTMQITDRMDQRAIATFPFLATSILSCMGSHTVPICRPHGRAIRI